MRNNRSHKTTFLRAAAACAVLLGLAMVCITPDAVLATEEKPAKPALSEAKSTAAKTLTVTWNKVEGADGYIVWYKTGDLSAKKKTVKAKKDQSTQIQSLTLQNLTGGKDYTVKVRSYREVKDSDASAGTTQLKSPWSVKKTVTIKHNKWSDLKDKYAVKEKTKQMIFVKYKGNSKATLILYKKVKNKDVADSTDGVIDPEGFLWEKVMSCDAYCGQNGLGKTKEGDRKTPVGDFTITKAFGVKKDPGSKMKYTKLKDYHYWCGDKEHYNTFIDIRKHPHNCRGEHLITYTKQYAYSMALNYNKECTYGKGSAIFLHCYGYYPYTLGCIAVPKDDMKTILKTCGDNTKICIYQK